MPGPRPKPTDLKILEGNPGKRRLPANEPKPAKAEGKALQPRRFLDRYGREAWNRLAPDLARLGLLTTVDMSSVERYCDLYSIWRRARLKLRSGFTTEEGRKKPEVGIVLETAAAMIRIEVEFGMTPSARTRIEVDPPVPVKPVAPAEGKSPGRFFRSET